MAVFAGLEARSPPAAAAAAACRHTTSRTPRRHARRPSMPMRVSASSAGAQQVQQQRLAARQEHRRLQDPAKLSGKSNLSVPVEDRGGQLSLDTYMRLPTEAYSELDPSMIFPKGGSSFLLKVPRVQLFDVWVAPEITVHVKPAEAPLGLIFESGECRLRGSELLERLGLDQRFVLYFHTTMSWQPYSTNGGTTCGTTCGTNGSTNGTTNGSSHSASNGANGSSNGAIAAAAAGGGAGLPAAATMPGQINAIADVQVWSEVVGPFRAIPRPILEATGNTVLGALMQALLPVFVGKLADDYHRWATSPQYRARRAAVAAEAQAQQQQQAVRQG